MEEDPFPGGAMAGVGEPTVGSSGRPVPTPSPPEQTVDARRLTRSEAIANITSSDSTIIMASGGHPSPRSSAPITTRDSSPNCGSPSANGREAEGWLTLELALFAYSTALMVGTVAEIKDAVNSWDTAAKVVFGVMSLGAFVSLGTGVMTAGYRRLLGMNKQQINGLSGFCARFSAILSTALFIVLMFCKFGRVGRVAGIFSAALTASIMTVFWIRENGQTVASVQPSGSDEAEALEETPAAPSIELDDSRARMSAALPTFVKDNGENTWSFAKNVQLKICGRSSTTWTVGRAAEAAHCSLHCSLDRGVPTGTEPPPTDTSVRHGCTLELRGPGRRTCIDENLARMSAATAFVEDDDIAYFWSPDDETSFWSSESDDEAPEETPAATMSEERPAILVPRPNPLRRRPGVTNPVEKLAQDEPPTPNVVGPRRNKRARNPNSR